MNSSRTSNRISNRTSSRSVLVAGASSGIGLATAQALSARGDRLVLVARDAARLQEVADALPGPAIVAPADVVDDDAVAAAVSAAVRAYGRLDGVVTTAQPMVYGTLEEVPPEAVARMVDVAVAGTANLARHALPRFREAGGGSLVVVSSLLAQIAVPAMGAYCAAKWGQLGLVRTLQVETRREASIGVSLVLPGAIDTPIYRQAGTFAGRAGSAPPPVLAPERVAEVCVRRLDQPRRISHVGPVNRLGVAGFRALPGLYELMAGPLGEHVVLRGPRRDAEPGNLFEARPEAEALRGGWSLTGRLRGRDGRRRWRG